MGRFLPVLRITDKNVNFSHVSFSVSKLYYILILVRLVIGVWHKWQFFINQNAKLIKINIQFSDHTER